MRFTERIYDLEIGCILGHSLGPFGDGVGQRIDVGDVTCHC